MLLAELNTRLLVSFYLCLKIEIASCFIFNHPIYLPVLGGLSFSDKDWIFITTYIV